MVKIDTARGMEYSMNDRDMYRDMALMFCEQHEQNAGQIKSEFQNKDWANYKIHVHGLKSNSRLVGGTELGDLAEKCEHAARDGQEDVLNAETETLLNLYAETVKALQSLDFDSL